MLRGMLAGGQGEAGLAVEFVLLGEEISVLALTDGCEVELLPVAQDHKRLLEGDAGPTPAGSGPYSPVGHRHPGAAGAGAAGGAGADPWRRCAAAGSRSAACSTRDS